MLLLKTARTFLAMAPHRCATLLLPTVACQSRLHILLSQRAAGFAIMSMLFVVTVLVAAPMLGKYDRVPSVCGNACLANTRCFQCPQSSHAISTFFSARQCLSVLVNTEVRSCATVALCTLFPLLPGPSSIQHHSGGPSSASSQRCTNCHSIITLLHWCSTLSAHRKTLMRRRCARRRSVPQPSPLVPPRHCTLLRRFGQSARLSLVFLLHTTPHHSTVLHTTSPFPPYSTPEA